MTNHDFEDAVAACNLLPGPASTQLSIYCVWRVAGPVGAVIGGVAFIVPGLIVILASRYALPGLVTADVVRAAGAGAGAAVAAVAVHAGVGLAPASWARTPSPVRWCVYAAAGAISAATVGPWLVVVLLGCGAIEVGVHRATTARGGASGMQAWPALVFAAATATGGLALAWTALKVGALSYGGGFVIIPLMQEDAVNQYHWMTNAQFLDAVALGQITPGPVVQTVAVVGYAAGGIAWGVFAAAIAFSPSFVLVLLGARRFDALRHNESVRAFLAGAGPAAIGAIFGVAVPLALALGEWWQAAVLGLAAVLLFVVKRGVVTVLLVAGAVGIVVVELGAPLP